MALQQKLFLFDLCELGMNKQSILLIFATLVLLSGLMGQGQLTTIDLLPGEKWWGGQLADAHLMPFATDYQADLRFNKHQWVQPLLLSNQGRFIWSDADFRFAVTDSTLEVRQYHGQIFQAKMGNSLTTAQQFVTENFLPPSSRLPDERLFTMPHYSIGGGQPSNLNQERVLAYAAAILAHDLPPGILVIGNGWQTNYGDWHFAPDRFPAPRLLLTELQQMGFAVVLWTCPFVDPSSDVFQTLFTAHEAFLKDPNLPQQAKRISWQGAPHALLDFTKKEVADWYTQQLRQLQKELGVAGFHFAAGDFHYYQNALSATNSSPMAQSAAYNQIGLQFSLHTFQAGWQTGGAPIVHQFDLATTGWEALQRLIPATTAYNLLGLPFTVPAHINPSPQEPDLLVRCIQAQALMPMLQLGEIPFDQLTDEHLKAYRATWQLHHAFIADILAAARQTAASGKPIIQSMEFAYPGAGYTYLQNQFLLGSKVLVAPVLQAGLESMFVELPEGKWRAMADKRVYEGPASLEIKVDINSLPIFIKVD